MRRRSTTIALGLAVLVTGVLVLWLLSRPAGRSARAAPAPRALGPDRRPCTAVSAISQSPSGRIDGCIELGRLSSGHYTVELQDTLGFGSLLTAMRSKVKAIQRIEGRRAVPRSLLRELQQARVPQPPVSLTISPSSGPPGTRVRVVGTLQTPPAHRSSSAQICWDGCVRGLDLSGANSVRWTSRRSFVAHIAVPDAPWLEGGIDRVIPMTSGTYPISVTCVTGEASCMLASAFEGSASFGLEPQRPRAWCPDARGCATLSVVPSRVPAGALVRVSGYLPLTRWDYGTTQFGGTAAVVRGQRTGAEVALSPDGTQLAARFGHAAVAVLGGPDLASLGRIRPRDTIASGQTQIAADPSDPRIVAWCASRWIDLSVDGRVRQISVAGVGNVLLRLHGLAADLGSRAADCVDVMPFSSTTLVAAFGGGLAQFKDTVPPIVFYALETRNGGRSWTPLPVPPGTDAAEFGGFRPARHGVEAIFAAAGRSAAVPEPARPLTERTTDRGGHWTPAALPCPRSGPCMTFGPFLPGNCAQGLSTQYVLRSANRGRSWLQSPILDPGPFACGDAQLSSLGGSRELLVDAISPYPLQLSGDGGVTWRNIAMPIPNELTGGASSVLQDFGPGGLTLLPDGSLLLTGGGAYTGRWQLLEPRAKRWCEVASSHEPWQLSSQASRITLIAGKLWWLTYRESSGNAPTPIDRHTLPLSALRCA